MIAPECVSRIGDHWCAATKMRALGSIPRSTVMNTSSHATHNHQAHAAHNHQERVGAIVARLFEQTLDMEMEFINLKAEVF